MNVLLIKMIIQCTSCDKKFSVPDTAITASGRLVQCSSCGNKWTQYPIKTKSEPSRPYVTPTKVVPPKKKLNKKKSGPVPYSKEYMQQKWGTSLENYAVQKGLTKKTKKISQPKKIQKQKILKSVEKPGFGFFNYIITFGILITFLIGILKYEQYRLVRKFPFLEPYINNFFETIENFKIIIFELLK